MAWPLSSHFSTMLQTPEVAFRDPLFKKAEILRNAQGQPKPWSGAFAVVYKATLPTGESKAVRVFSSESPERQERYEKISQYLAGKQIDCLVPFEYRENAIRSLDGKWYPLVIMDWVEGHTLFQWVDLQYTRRNTTAIRVAADVWLDVVQELESAGIAHGDYQQSNIMVSPDGQIKLVDYDCMCVPELVGRRNLEIGVEPYQHPDRNGATRLSLTLDHFSSLMIYIALRALAADLGLWQRYIIAGSYDKFLFRKEDIQEPQKSKLIADLMESPDAEVRGLTDLLLRCAVGPMELVPALWTVAGPFRQIDAMLRAERWSDAVTLLTQYQITNIPANYKGLVDRAYMEVWKSKAQSEFEALPLQEKSEKADRAICRVCNDVFLRQFPISDAMRARIMEARKRVEKLDQLAILIKASETNATLERERAIADIGNYFTSSYSYVQCPRVMKAQNTVDVIGAYMNELNKPVPSEVELADCWKAIKRSKCQSFLTREEQQRAEIAVQRAPRIKILEEVSLDLPPDQFDRRIQSAWNEQLMGDSPQAAQFRPLVEVTQKRQFKLIQLSDAIEANQTPLIAELLTDPLLRDYPFSGSWGPFLRDKSDQWTHARGMLGAVEDDDPQAFIQHFDAQALTENEALFSGVQARIQQWVLEYILPRKNNGLKPVLGRASILPEKKSVILRWTWMPPRFGDTCHVGFSKTTPLETDRPMDIPLAFEYQITRKQWEQTGSRLQLPTKREWNGMNVIVWGVIRYANVTCYTEPLVLGTLTVKHSWFS